MESRTIKKDSTVLETFAKAHPDTEYQSPKYGQSHVLFVFGDSYYVNEMEDGRFWATTNDSNPDDDRTFEQHKADLLNQVDFKELGNGEVELILPENSPSYYGAYFKSAEDAYNAITRWQIGETMPKEYRPPINI